MCSFSVIEFRFPLIRETIRSFNILQRLLKNHTVYLGAFVDDPDDHQHINTLKSMLGGRCKLICLPKWLTQMRMVKALALGEPLSTAPFYSPRLQRWVRKVVEEACIERAIVFGTAMVPYLLENPGLSPDKAIFDMVDIDSDKWRQFALDSSGLMRLIYRRESEKLFRLECRAASEFSSTLLVSPFERKCFSELAPVTSGHLKTSENGVDLKYFDPKGQHADPFGGARDAIVMTGRMDYRPNSEGARWFIEAVLPVIRRSRPTAQFYVVGARPPASLKALAGKNDVVVTGSVQDVRPYLAHAAVIVAPLHQARGVQNKVLEAMAMEKLVVATTPATRALGVSNRKQLLIADDTNAFASAVLDALAGSGVEGIAAHGRRYAELHHNWDRTLSIFDEFLEGQKITSEETPVRQSATAS